jgi:small-conductance mechanosensitive channel
LTCPEPETIVNGYSRAARLARRILVALMLAAPILLWTAGADAATVPAAKAGTLSVANREIVVFRAALLGVLPSSRAARAAERIDALSDAELTAPVRAIPATLGDLVGITILVGGKAMFSLLPGDLDPEDELSLAQVAEQARARLAEALRARADQRRWPVLLSGLLHTGVVTAVALALLWVLRRFGRVLASGLERHRAALADRGGALMWREYVARLAIRLLQLGRWVLFAMLLYGWLTYVLDQFPLTEPFGRGLVHSIVSLLDWLVEGIVASIPGIVTVALIVFVTQAIAEVITQFFDSVRAGRTHVPFIHADTVAATRRIVIIITWTLALVVAYPFIPGSDSDAFKGLSVLFGLVLSLGSTGLVNQMMSGLVVVYSRALRRGDFVSVNGIDGVVSEIGALATKVVTMTSEEVTIPNAALIGNPIRNYTKLAGSKGTLLSTKVTIGYDAPWRQVHALLELAASRTPGLRTEPAPFVYQRALSDFYVEYEVFAYIDRPLERVPVLSALHQNIQDVFNEHGVQIMSPHFIAQPAQTVVVPPEGWYAKPARDPKVAGG